MAKKGKKHSEENKRKISKIQKDSKLKVESAKRKLELAKIELDRIRKESRRKIDIAKQKARQERLRQKIDIAKQKARQEKLKQKLRALKREKTNDPEYRKKQNRKYYQKLIQQPDAKQKKLEQGRKSYKKK